MRSCAGSALRGIDGCKKGAGYHSSAFTFGSEERAVLRFIANLVASAWFALLNDRRSVAEIRAS